MASDKNYVGRGWKKTFSNGGHVINISLKKDDIDLLPVNEYGDIKLVVAERREPDNKTKATHTVYQDTYVKGGSSSQAPPPNEPPF